MLWYVMVCYGMLWYAMVARCVHPVDLLGKPSTGLVSYKPGAIQAWCPHWSIKLVPKLVPKLEHPKLDHPKPGPKLKRYPNGV